LTKLAVLTQLSSAATTPTRHKAIAEWASKLAHDALGQNRLLAAAQLEKLALREARLSLNGTLVAEAENGIVEVTQRATAKPIAASPN
jgi:hypothetical protein